MLALKPFRSKAAGLPDLCNYAALIAKGVVLGKDGSLMAGFFYTPGDDASATDDDRNYVSFQMNRHLLNFDSGWCLWVEAVRLPSPGYPDAARSHFPDPISKMIDEERREMFHRENAHYETEYALVLQYLPPLQSETKILNIFIDDDNKKKNSSDQIMMQTLAGFEKRLQDFQDGTKDLLKMRRMGSITIGAGNDSYESDELVNYLHFALTGETMALRIPDCPMYLDSWLGYPCLWSGTAPKVDDKYIASISIDGFPSSSAPGILSLFEGLAVPFRWSSRYIFLEQHEALGTLSRYRRIWNQSKRSFGAQMFNTSGGVINTDAVSMTKEVEQSMADSRSGMVSFGYYTPVVVLMSENQELLMEQARYVKKIIEAKGFHARIETINAVEAWLGTLPGHPYPNVRRPLIHTLNLADLLPLSGIWPGLTENPCGFYPAGTPPLMQTVTTGATPFRLNLHDGDVGHTLIFGPTGAGKSTLLATILAQFRRYQSKTRPDGRIMEASITAFDKGRSLYTLCKAVGGQHYDIGSDGGDDLALCPLSDIDSPSDALWAVEWIATCFELQTGVPPTPAQKNAITNAITLMSQSPDSGRSLTDFLSTVQSKTIQEALNHYTVTGSMGHLLDGYEDPLKKSSFVVYEIDELMALGAKNAIPVLLYLFRRFEQSLDGQPAVLSLDEAWVMLAHPVFREKLREWLKELRKKNCAVLIATQSLTDAVGSGLIATLLEQCPTKIFLPNKEAKSEGTKEHPGPAVYYKIFGLNDNEIDLLSIAEYKRDYYYKSPMGRRPFRLGLGPLALSFVAVSDIDTLRKVKACEAEHGENWPLYWLRENGVDYEQYVR
jgi:type IV secretion/conjugal transfer VirB4 family ATPase